MIRSFPRPAVALLIAALTACAPGPRAGTGTAAAPATPTPALIATPRSEAGPASLEARVTSAGDSEIMLRFMATPDGSVQQAAIVETTLPPDTAQAVLAAFATLHFRPYLEKGEAAAHEFRYPLFFGPDAVSNRTRYFCQHASEVYAPQDRCDIITQGSWRVYRVTPAYPESMLATPVAGAVTLSFDLDQSGVPSNIKVTGSNPPGVFDTAAMVALQQWYFEPVDAHAPAAGLQHASVTLHFRPPSGGY